MRSRSPRNTFAYPQFQARDLEVQVAMLPALAEAILCDQSCHAGGRVHIGCGEHPFTGEPECLNLGAEQLADQSRLAAEILVDRRDANFRARGHLVDVRCGVAMLAEQRLCRSEDRLLAFSSLEFSQAGHN